MNKIKLTKYDIKMARIKNTSLLHSFLFLLVTVLLCSCSDEREGYATPVEGKQKSVTFSVRVPGAATPKSYALGEPEENEVKTIEILLFDTADKYAAAPVYSNTITTDPGDSKLKTFTVKVPEGDYNMVILANARASLATALPTIALGDAKAVVLNKILLANAGKWNSTSASAGYISIPMWGELTGITVSSTMPPNTNIAMSRMIAKIDVSLNAVSQGKLKLRSVRLYNYNNQGAVAPLATAWNNVQQKVTAPSVPASAGKPTNPGQKPLVYDGAAITTANVSCEGEIYTFEAVQGTAAGLLTNTCLVVGGLYDTDANETFYRIDFANTTGGITTYLDLLRNHNYKVTVSDVLGAGLPSPEEAFKSRPVNILASVLAWNDGKFTEFDINDQYLLGLSQGEFLFSKEQRTAADTDNTLSVITDYVPGWKVEKIVDGAGNPAGWLNCSSTSGSNPTGNDIKLLMGANATGALRTAYIHLSAERLTYIVKVEQDILSKMAIDITDITGTTPVNTLFFSAAKDVQPIQQQFKINWSPTTQDLNFNTSSMTNAFTFATGAGLDVIPASGTLASIDNPKSYTIRPTAITTANLAGDPFYERTSTILYTVTDGLSMATKTLNLRQIVPNLVTDAKASYLLNGSRYTFNVRSNAAWRIKSVTPSQVGLLNLQALDNLQVGTSGSYNTGVGLPINFTVSNNKALSGKVTLVFESTALPQLFSDITVEFALSGEYYPAAHTGWAGSNIYWDGSKLTFAGVGDQSKKNYQGVYFQWGSLYGISPVGNWTTTTILYTPQGTAAAANSLGFGTWSSWPRHPDTNVTSSPPIGKTARDRAYLYEVTDGATGIGDICKYLTEKGWAPGSPATKWRQPTSMEFEAANSYANYGTWAGVISNQTNGTFAINNGYTKTGSGTPSFPAAGYRSNNDGALSNAGTGGCYWSATVNGVFGYTLIFNSSNVSPSNINNRALGFSVRCVQE